jgi:D-Tyr-tRNAtyr deacylase
MRAVVQRVSGARFEVGSYIARVETGAFQTEMRVSYTNEGHERIGK